jgi:membrane fusion protein (multidrug efflux system)
MIFIGMIALALLLHWLLIGRHHVSTDNAYVQAEITRISSQLNARVAEVLVDDNQRVAKGDLLVRLEADDFRLDLQRAEAALATREAELAQAQSRLQQQDSLIDASQADVIASSANLDRTQTDLSRAKTLRKPGFVSEERVTSLATDSRVAGSLLTKAQADLRARRLQIDALNAEVQQLQALISTASADVEQARLNLTRTEIHAPLAGVVGQRTARAGQVVQAGSFLLALVPVEDIWIQANFKETQIARLQPGMQAELTFDSFPDTPIQAQVDSLFAASGAQFSLLPPDNATGNFTKVVQRIPVKLRIPADNPLRGRIRPGMSVEVDVDLRTGTRGD